MSYIGNEPIVSATRTVTEVTATAGQTTFTANGGYTVGFIDVFVNGSQLQSSDFTATNGSTVVLTNACTVNDDVKLVAWGKFNVANLATVASTGSAADLSTGTLASARMPAGSVLQVVQGTQSAGYMGTNSTTYTTTNITASITPKSATSKILIQFQTSLYLSAGIGPSYLTIYRDSTNLSSSGVGGIGSEFYGLGNAWIPCSGIYLDSPATTSSTTYSVYVKVAGGTGSNVLVGADSGMINAIILTEIAG